MKWQPIETAPRDGRSVILWPVDTDHNMIALAFWAGSGVYEGWYWFEAQSSPEPGYQVATHWQPLPEPPQ